MEEADKHHSIKIKLKLCILGSIIVPLVSELLRS